MNTPTLRSPRLRALAPRLLAALAGLLSLDALAAPTKLYRYMDQGMPVYSNRKPENVAYTEIVASATRPAPRPQPAALPAPAPRAAKTREARGWAASCEGVTEHVMQQRAGQLDEIVARNAKRHRVPAALIRAVMRVESCFDLRAVSRVGARGVMQLMPATALALGVRDSFNAEQNIAGGVRFLRSLLERFDHDVRLAVAAYNAGPTAVSRHKGIPPFPETRQYVERVMAAYRKTGAPVRSGAAG